MIFWAKRLGSDLFDYYNNIIMRTPIESEEKRALSIACFALKLKLFFDTPLRLINGWRGFSIFSLYFIRSDLLISIFSSSKNMQNIFAHAKPKRDKN